jgi:hypothetical protein
VVGDQMLRTGVQQTFRHTEIQSSSYNRRCTCHYSTGIMVWHETFVPVPHSSHLPLSLTVSYLWMAQQRLDGVCDEQDVPRTRNNDHESIHYLQQDIPLIVQQHSLHFWRTGAGGKATSAGDGVLSAAGY